MSNRYTISTRSLGDGNEPCYAVYYRREIIATFPIIDPSTSDAREYAEHFVAAMDASMDQMIEKLVRS